MSSERAGGKWHSPAKNEAQEKQLAEQLVLAASLAKRLRIVKWVVCAGILSGMAVAPTLWATDRGFPTVAAIPGFPELPQAASLCLALLLVVSLCAVGWIARPGLLVLAPIGIWGLSALFDVDRVQPWMYEYALILCGLAAVQWGVPGSVRSRAGLGACQAVVIGIYFWSGVQKLNAGFAHEVWPWLLQPLGPWATTHLQWLWPIAPLFEASIGILLLVPRTRSWGLGGLTAMHGFLLWDLGPLGHSYDSIVWPWNVYATVLAYLLFFRCDARVTEAWESWPARAILGLIWVMPALSFVGLWDGFLSGSYYSGKLRDGWIYLTADAALHLPREYAEANSGLVEDSPRRYRLDILGWSMSRLNAPPYGEPRYYTQIVKKLQAAGVPASEMVLFVRDPPSLTSDDAKYTEVPVR